MIIAVGLLLKVCICKLALSPQFEKTTSVGEYWRRYEIITKNYFFVCHKNRREHNQNFELRYFMINLNFGLSKYQSSYRKVYLLLTNILSSLLWKAKKDMHRLNCTSSFLLCLKRNDAQTFKSSNSKKRFLQCACHWYNLLR